MALQNDVSSSVIVVDQNNPVGTEFGQSATDKVSFYGATPVVQPTSAAQAAITDSSGGTASATSGVQALTSSYNSTIIGNALATILAQNAQIRTSLVNLGLWKGS